MNEFVSIIQQYAPGVVALIFIVASTIVDIKKTGVIHKKATDLLDQKYKNDIEVKDAEIKELKTQNELLKKQNEILNTHLAEESKLNQKLMSKLSHIEFKEV